MPNKKTLLIDFDATLATYEGWKGEEELGSPLEHARAACFALEKQFKLICFTTRDQLFVEPWLRTYGFSCIKSVTNTKIPAFALVDDRVILFDGKWDDAMIQKIKDFKPWWEK